MEASVTEIQEAPGAVQPDEGQEPEPQAPTPETPQEPPQGEPAADLEGQAADEQPAPELEVEGTGQLSLKVGGVKPEKATMKLRGGSIHVAQGQIEKGESINLLVKATCAEVHFVDKRDTATGEITGTERRQIMKITGVEKVGGE